MIIIITTFSYVSIKLYSSRGFCLSPLSRQACGFSVDDIIKFTVQSRDNFWSRVNKIAVPALWRLFLHQWCDFLLGDHAAIKSIISELSLWAPTLLRLSFLVYDCGWCVICEPWLMHGCWGGQQEYIVSCDSQCCTHLSCSALYCPI